MLAEASVLEEAAVSLDEADDSALEDADEAVLEDAGFSSLEDALELTELLWLDEPDAAELLCELLEAPDEAVLLWELPDVALLAEEADFSALEEALELLCELLEADVLLLWELLEELDAAAPLEAEAAGFSSFSVVSSLEEADGSSLEEALLELDDELALVPLTAISNLLLVTVLSL